MMGEALYREVVKSRPMGDDRYFAGCVCHVGNGRFHIEFIVYWNQWGMAGRLSPREVCELAPDLSMSIRHHGDELREYLVDADARRPPMGVGSFSEIRRDDHPQKDAGICECNGETGSDYARAESVCASSGAPGSAGSGTCASVQNGAPGVLAVPDGGFARVSRLTARQGKGGNG